MKHIKKIFEIDENPMYSHELRMKKGYRPKYRSGMIAIRFLDDEELVHPEDELQINYHDMFSNDYSQVYGDQQKKEKKFVENFERRYNIKLSDYRRGSDDFYLYFTCEPGKEEEIIKKVSKDRIVKVVDFVDVRRVETIDILEEVYTDLYELIDEVGEISDKKYREKLTDIIERLKKCL